MTLFMLTPGERLSPEFKDRFRDTVNAEENPVIYLGVDPGKHNGICGYDIKYHVLFSMTIMADDIIDFIELFEHIKTCVIEDYRVFAHKAQAHVMSNLETPRVIGRFEGWAARNKVELIKQGSSIKKNAYAWLGQKPPTKSNPLNHQLDANAHFMYWAIRTRRINAADLIRR